MRYRYLDDFRRGISVFAIFPYGIAVLGTPQCPPPCCSIDIISVITSMVLSNVKLFGKGIHALVDSF